MFNNAHSPVQRGGIQIHKINIDYYQSKRIIYALPETKPSNKQAESPVLTFFQVNPPIFLHLHVFRSHLDFSSTTATTRVLLEQRHFIKSLLTEGGASCRVSRSLQCKVKNLPIRLTIITRSRVIVALVMVSCPSFTLETCS